MGTSAETLGDVSCGIEAEHVVFEATGSDGVSDAPEDGPAGEADFEVIPEVEVRFLTVVPGACRVIVSGELAQHDVEAVGSERRPKR